MAWAPKSAIRRGVGTMVLDVRRGDGPEPCFNYSMASIATADKVLLERHPRLAAPTVPALDRTHAALKEDVSLATTVRRKLFPEAEAELIGELIRRDLPSYTTGILLVCVAGINRFARDLGILSSDVPYERIVAVEGRAQSSGR